MSLRTKPAAALALLLAACRGPAAAAPDTLAILQERDVEGLDPHTGGNLWQTQTALANLYEGLVALDAGMRVVPALATEWTNPSDLTLEMTLRPGVHFHDGSGFSADDVVFSFERARTHKHSLLKAALAEVEAVEATGPLRVRLRTRTPDAALVTRLRDVGILSRSCLARLGERGLGGQTCGTGPYLVRQAARGPVLEAERFAQYWAGPPDIPRVRFLSLHYDDPQLAQHLTPSTRLVFYARPNSPRYAQARREAVLHRGSGLGVSYLGFDLHGEETPGVTLADGSHRNPFRDRRVRQAVALALDRVRLNQAVYQGEAILATQLVPGVVYGFDRSLPEPRRDLARARELLAEAGVPRFALRLDVRAIMQEYAEPLRASLAELGLEVKLEVLDEDAFFTRVRGGQSSLYLLRFSCRTGDAQELLDKWVHSKEEARGLGRSNHSYDVNPVPGLDALIEKARGELRPSERGMLLQEVMRRMEDEHLVVPLLQDLDYTFVSPDVEWQARADTYRLAREARFKR